MVSDFLSSTLPDLMILGANFAIAFYAAYLALSVRRGLAVPIYRSRALWTAILAVMFALAAPLIGNLGFYTILLAVLFIWIDRTINTLIRLDFLRRDLLEWKKFRYVYWIFLFGDFVLGYAYLLAYGSFPSHPSPLVGSPLFAALALLLFFVPVTYAVIVLALGSTRTRDMTFRSHVKWGGYLIIAFLLETVTYIALANDVVVHATFLPISFCLYRMARLLVPTGKLTTD